jgi:hypothetical protein
MGLSFFSNTVKLDVSQIEKPPAGLFQRLLSGHADVCEQVRIVGEVAQYLALAVPRPSKALAAPALGKRYSPVFLMKPNPIVDYMQGQGSHRQAPQVVKC